MHGAHDGSAGRSKAFAYIEMGRRLGHCIDNIVESILERIARENGYRPDKRPGKIDQTLNDCRVFIGTAPEGVPWGHYAPNI